MKKKINRKLTINSRTILKLSGNKARQMRGGTDNTTIPSAPCTVYPECVGISPQSRCVGMTAKCCGT